MSSAAANTFCYIMLKLENRGKNKKQNQNHSISVAYCYITFTSFKNIISFLQLQQFLPEKQE